MVEEIDTVLGQDGLLAMGVITPKDKAAGTIIHG